MIIYSYELKNYIVATLLFSIMWFGQAMVVANAETRPFIIAPMIEGLGFCQEGADQPNRELALSKCESRHNYGTAELNSILDKLEPNGANGKVQIGYTIGINLLTLGDQKKPYNYLIPYTLAVTKIKRPVILYLFANHFAGSTLKSPLDSDSLAKFPDQSIPNEKYFQDGISPITLNMSANLLVNRKRFAALKEVGIWYNSLPIRAKKRIIAITMAGELHHFYDDFSNGMGKYEDIRVTDYSPETTKEFQSWLAKRYRTISIANSALNSTFISFDSIYPPSQDIKKNELKNFSQFFDSYAHGLLPIEGWLQTLPFGHALKIYLDGEAIGTAEYGLNRQDVYEGVPSVKNAQVGFRYILDFSKLPRGKHTVQVIVEGKNSFELAKRSISIMGQSQAPIHNLGRDHIIKSAPKSIRFWLDRPANEQAFFYNPLAKDWYDFRSEQVTNAYNEWFRRSIESGFPKDKLFTHQIAVATIGGWNPILQASDGSLQGKHRYKKGINLYAGSASMDLLRKHYIQPNEEFGIPEFHTQDWKNPEAPLRILRELHVGGAKFISPYFLSLIPDRYRTMENKHNRFRLSPDNFDYGSNHLYRAIIDFANE